MRVGFKAVIFFVFVYSCSLDTRDKGHSKHQKEIVLQQTVRDFIGSSEDHDYFLIYYFDGECSLCFDNVVNLQKLVEVEFFHVASISIGFSNNSLLFDYYKTKFDLGNDVLFDAYDFLAINNQDLMLNDVFLINRRLEILASGNPLDNVRVLRNYKEVISIHEK